MTRVEAYNKEVSSFASDLKMMTGTEKLTTKSSFYSRSRAPPILLTVLVLTIIVLAYYLWTLTATNQTLLREMNVIRSSKLMVDQRRTALESKVFYIENQKHVLEKDLSKEKERRRGNERTAFEKASALREELEIKQRLLDSAQKKEVCMKNQFVLI